MQSTTPGMSIPQEQGFGLVRGPGTATSDSIPAALSDGEVVIPADKVRAFGAAQIMALVDKGGLGVKKPPVKDGRVHAADGGLVDEAAPGLGAVNRTGNSYSGGNVSGPISVNGQAPGGTFSSIGAGAPPAAPATAAAPIAPTSTSPAAAPPPAPFNPALGVGRPNALGSLADTNAQIATIRASYAAPGLGAQPAAVKPAPPSPALGALRPAASAASTAPAQPQFFVGGGMQQPPAGAAPQPTPPAAAPAPVSVPPPPPPPTTPPAPYTNRTGGGPPQMVAYRDGGMVEGPGTATSDSVPAMLSKGEIVMPADTVEALGAKRLLNAIDATHKLTGFGVRKSGRPAFADGGYVEDPREPDIRYEEVQPGLGARVRNAGEHRPPVATTAPVPATDLQVSAAQSAGMSGASQIPASPGSLAPVPVAPAPIAAPAYVTAVDGATELARGAAALSPAAAAPVATAPALGVVQREGSSYSGGSVTGDVSINGEPTAGSVGTVSAAGVSGIDRLAQASRDIAFEKDKQTWRNPNDPTPGLGIIDSGGANRNADFNDSAAVRTLIARGAPPGRNGAQVFAAQLGAAQAPIEQRAAQAALGVRDAGDTRRAQIAEQGLDSRARVVDARQQQQLALEGKKLALDVSRDDRQVTAAQAEQAQKARVAQLDNMILNGNPIQQKAAAAQKAALMGKGLDEAGKTGEVSTAIRKEFESLPEVKNYKQALPSFRGIEDAVKRNTPMSDINIVYGIAKLYDPNSVVREGEYSTVANAPGMPERVKGWAQYVAGGGKLTDEVKKQILTEAKSRMGTFDTEYGAARDRYSDIAKRSSADPSLVVPQDYKPAVSAPAAQAAPPQVAELQRRAASDPAVAARLKQMGY
ncbi:hypothetical protein NU688_33740 [Variovorax sp. ZS18.2.2]|uniref:hypothetical protein n=1 Tax=Variovorax sp. ZS18.2.2 TaxID=2971255 RepID=UPI002150EBAF|nr:hypothetical protein [Variovorax sp. ZS18.2.2]MCR6481162.1 hypothetical protein [Variovorax sp. ZS18.2.2]